MYLLPNGNSFTIIAVLHGAHGFVYQAVDSLCDRTRSSRFSQVNVRCNAVGVSVSHNHYHLLAFGFPFLIRLDRKVYTI